MEAKGCQMLQSYALFLCFERNCRQFVTRLVYKVQLRIAFKCACLNLLRLSINLSVQQVSCLKVDRLSEKYLFNCHHKETRRIASLAKNISNTIFTILPLTTIPFLGDFPSRYFCTSGLAKTKILDSRRIKRQRDIEINLHLAVYRNRVGEFIFNQVFRVEFRVLCIRQ